MGLGMLEYKNQLLDLLKQIDYQSLQLSCGYTTLDLELILPPWLHVCLVLKMEYMHKDLHPNHDPLTHKHLTLYQEHLFLLSLASFSSFSPTPAYDSRFGYAQALIE